MNHITYRKLKLEDCVRIQEMNPTQYIKRAWREIDGKRILVDINYLDSDWPNGYEYHFNHLRKTILENGIAFGAFDEMNHKLVGFVSMNRDQFGEKFNYVLLDQLFISLEYRNKGIGKKLFYLIKEEVKNWHIDKIYICAGSAEETIAFYFAIGCQEAIEVNKILYDSDPRDYQLEYSL